MLHPSDLIGPRLMHLAASLLCMCMAAIFPRSMAFNCPPSLHGGPHRRRVAVRGRSTESRCTEGSWRDAEDWALLDAAPAFTVGDGPFVATFWQSLAAATPALSARSADRHTM